MIGKSGLTAPTLDSDNLSRPAGEYRLPIHAYFRGMFVSHSSRWPTGHGTARAALRRARPYRIDPAARRRRNLRSSSFLYGWSSAET